MGNPDRLEYLMTRMLGEDTGWELDELHVRLSKATSHEEKDAILRECHDGECMVCGVIICPKHEPLHFHHDGCPCCSFDDSQAIKDSNG